MGRNILRTLMIRKLIYIFFVHIMNYNALCKVTANVNNERCVHPWKSDLRATNNSTQQLIDHLLKLENLISGFTSSITNKETPMRADLQTCAKNTDCRILTLSDKTEKDSLLLCISVHETETCYTSSCSFIGRRKRALDIKAHNVTEIDQNKNDLKGADLFCNFTNDEKRYRKSNPIETRGKNKSRNVIVRPNNTIYEETSTFKRGNICNSQTTKETNPEIYVMFCLSGMVFGILIGICVTCVFLKRVSKMQLTVSQEKNRNINITGKDILYDDAEYSEIPCTQEYFKVEKTLLSGEKTDDIWKHRDEDSKIRKSLQASPSMIVQVDISEPLFQSDSYPKMESIEVNEYVEPLCHEYHHLTPMNTKSDLIMEHTSLSTTEQIDLSVTSCTNDSFPKQELTHRNTTNNDIMQPQDQKDKYYSSNTEETKEGREKDINTNVVQNNFLMSGMSQERKVGETKMCTSKDEREAADSVYFVLNTAYLNSTQDDVKAEEANGKLYVELEKRF